MANGVDKTCPPTCPATCPPTCPPKPRRRRKPAGRRRKPAGRRRKSRRGGAIVKKPVVVYIEKVYEEGDFAGLGIGA